jgi:hypothetical protein
VTHFDCLHDMGDPVGAAAYVRQSLAPDGTWMIVEPAAGDPLGAQAGEARIREVVEQAGFSRFRRAAETPFNAVYEARP